MAVSTYTQNRISDTSKSAVSDIGRKLISAVLAVFVAFTVCLPPSYAAGKTRQSSFDYKKYNDHEKYRLALFWRMNSVFKKIAGYMDDSTTLPIPGLVKTYSSSDGKKKSSDQFIPQGICRAGRFWLITAFDADSKCNSVIYAVDPRRRELVATIVLPNRYHAGGIAFDGENIWITGDTSDNYEGDPFLQYITFQDFRQMKKEPLHIVSGDEISDPVYIKNKPSFLEYDEGTLWVGTYIGKSNTRESYMYGYKVIKGENSARLSTFFPSVISGLDSSAQGADIDGNNLYVSSSYKGYSIVVKSSFITKYNIKPIKGKNAKKNLSVTSRETARVEVPKMNEEILIENGNIYINFESASESWWNAVIKTDRILPLDRSLWDK